MCDEFTVDLLKFKSFDFFYQQCRFGMQKERERGIKRWEED